MAATVKNRGMNQWPLFSNCPYYSRSLVGSFIVAAGTPRNRLGSGAYWEHDLERSQNRCIGCPSGSYLGRRSQQAMGRDHRVRGMRGGCLCPSFRSAVK